MDDTIAVRLDVSGVCCPMPLIQLAKAIKPLTSGQFLEITGNDPILAMSVRDFCQANHHAVIKEQEGACRRVTLLIKVGG